jgi:hypothetical protein
MFWGQNWVICFEVLESEFESTNRADLGAISKQKVGAIGAFEGVNWRVDFGVVLGPKKRVELGVFEGVIWRANLGVVLGQEGGAIEGFFEGVIWKADLRSGWEKD